jgi:hypothetical protein
MTFLYPLLLGGLLLAGIPVLLHLIMRQKPKHLLFPAFRFLLHRLRTNQRKLRLRHLLLLALRLLLIVGICLALARPKVFSERLNLTTDRPVAAVLLFDTSYSMEYVLGGKSRLEEAKRRALELLDELPNESRLAILDTGEPGGEWLPSLSLARERIVELHLRPANGPVTERLADAYRLLAELDQDTEAERDALPRFLYVLSDRTQSCWDPRRLTDLRSLRDRVGAPVHSIFVDVGIESPVDIALVSLDVSRQLVAVDEAAVLRATVMAIGAECDTEVVCRIDGEKSAERKAVKLAAGQSQVLVFERKGLAPGPHQAEITLAASDALPFNNALFASFEVHGGRRVLTLVDEPSDADYWTAALDSYKAFRPEVRRLSETRDLSPRDLRQYQAICLLNLAKTGDDLWQKLKDYVRDGGGVAVVPGGEELERTTYESEAARLLLPGKFVRVVQAADPGAIWRMDTHQHPALARFGEWSLSQNVDFLKFPPAALRYWEIVPYEGDSDVLVSYADTNSHPALLERKFDRKQIHGRLLLFTTPFDRRHLDANPAWNDYLKTKTSFYLVLVNQAVGYLTGDAEEGNFNFQCGQTIPIGLPPTPRISSYTLQGPGLEGTQALITRAENQPELSITRAVHPGNYVLLDESGRRTASFSVNVPAEESQLNRVPPEQIEGLLGEGALLSVGHATSLREAIQGHWNQPVELFPWIMIAIVLALAVENLLANKFYRRESTEDPEPDAPARELAGAAGEYATGPAADVGRETS